MFFFITYANQRSFIETFISHLFYTKFSFLLSFKKAFISQKVALTFIYFQENYKCPTNNFHKYFYFQASQIGKNVGTKKHYIWML